MCRDAELPAADYVRLVLRGVGRRVRPDRRQRRARRGPKAAVGYHVRSARRGEVLLTGRTGVAGCWTPAAPGRTTSWPSSGLCAAAVRTPGRQPTLDGLAGRTTTCPQVWSIDSELRWAWSPTWPGWAASTRRGHRRRGSRPRQDRGRRRVGGGARAARPTAEAKAEAWRAAATRTPSTRNRPSERSARRFWQRGQDEVLTPYLDRWFTVMEDIAGQRNGWSGGHWPSAGTWANAVPAPVRRSCTGRPDQSVDGVRPT